MSAKRSGEWIKQVLWPMVAGLAVWLAAGRPVLGVWFAVCLIGFRLFFRWLSKREIPGRRGAAAR